MIRFVVPLMLPVLMMAPPAFGQTSGPSSEQTVTLPGGCEAYATIQKRSCTVSTLFHCEGDPDGHQRRMDFDEETMTYMGQIDAETRWVETFYASTGTSETLAPNPVDPASFSTLIETGYDDWDFGTISSNNILTIFRGYDRLTGETLLIDGVTLEQTEFSIVAYDPAGPELWRSVGNEYIQRDWRTFLSGTRTVTVPGEVFETDGRPVEFAFPGAPGFQSTEPRYDCGVTLSKGVSR